MECRAWLSTCAGFLNVSNYFLSELGYCYLVVRILNSVSFFSEDKNQRQEHH